MFCWNKQFAHHTLALFLIAAQATALDYYLVTFDISKYGSGYRWLGWIAADVLVLVVALTTYIVGRKYVYLYLREIARTDPENPKGPLRHMGILPYTWLAWLVYSMVFVGKIVAIFKTFGTHLLETDHLGINTLEFTFGAAAAIFMLLVGGLEHLATNAQKHYIRWMQHYVLLEIIDCIEFLTSLFVAAEVGKEEEKAALPSAVQDTILAFACINLLAPAHALYRLSSLHNRHAETSNRFFLFQTLVGTVFGNIPYFIVRVYLWQRHSYITGLFAMKNLIGIVTDCQEVVEYIHSLRHGEGEEEAATKSGAKHKFSVTSLGESLRLHDNAPEV